MNSTLKTRILAGAWAGCALIAGANLSAATFTVTNANDAGSGSLRQAITDANAAPGADVISFSISSGTITLASSLPTITGAVTITGPGATGVTVNGANRYRVFAVDAGSGTVSISGLTVSNGKALGGAGGWGGANGGGGGGAGGLGGGLFVVTGNVQLSGLVFSGNSAQGGSGASQNPATVSTSGWHAAGGGGGGLGGNGANMIPANNQFDYGSGTGGAGGSGGILGGAGGAAASAGGPGGGGGGGSDQQNGGNGGYGGGGGGAGGHRDPNTNPNSGTYPNNRSSSSTFVYAGGAGGFGGGGGGGTGWNAGGGAAGFGGGAGADGTADTNYVNTAGGGGGGAGFGGAIFVKDGAVLTATDCTFSGNTVAGGAGDNRGGNGQGLGESIFLGGDTTIGVSTSTLTLSQTLGGGSAVGAQGALTKRGAGTLVLSAANSYTGGTTVAEGTLRVANTSGTATGTGTVSVSSGAIVGGTGKVGALTLASGSAVAPGASSGTLSAGSTTWAGGAGYTWEINKADGVAGASSGWDLLAVTGTLTLNATSASKFTLSVVSLGLSGTAGPATGFSPTSDYTFTIATATGGIVGFDAAAFTVNTSGFQNAFGGTWSVAQSGNNLNVVYRGAAVVVPTQLTVSNVAASQQAGTRSVAITYTLSQPQSLPCAVTMQASRDNGVTWETVTSATGALGTGITSTPSGAAKTITWTVGADWPAQLFPQVKIRIAADDGQGGSAAPAGFAQIPAGTFTMGDNLDGLENAVPRHAVTLATFNLAKTETTKAEWDEVRAWALTHNYRDILIGAGKAANHPVQSITWYDAVKWCNARSEKEGLVPVYYIDDAQTTVYRNGDVNLTNAQVKWLATGYRLPTEAEWEYAARGGLAGKRFPWGDTITQQQANYNSLSVSSMAYDVSTTGGYHRSYATGGEPYTSPVASFAANGYGLFDVTGNVWEWCWDRLGTYTSEAVTSPQGPATGTSSVRMRRGGSWSTNADDARTANRGSNTAYTRSESMGFRIVRNSGGAGGGVLVSSAAFALNLTAASSALDLNSWTSRKTSVTSNDLWGAAWGGNQFVAVGFTGTILTSPDGAVWTSRTSGTSRDFWSVIWNGRQFLATGNSGTIVTSPDGATWTTRATGTTNYLSGAAWSGSQFVAVGASGTILTSPDGVTWTSRTSGTTASFTGVVWSGTLFVATGTSGTILTSPDGTTWTSRSSGSTTKLNGVIWAGSQFVAVGNGGRLVTSPDGITWTSRESGTSNSLWLGTSGGNQILAVGNNGTIVTSTDGVTWTSRTSGVTTSLNAGAWSGSQFVVVGDYGVILTSGGGSTSGSIPVISAQPQAQSATAGNSVTFTVTATGTPAPTYQWRKDGANIAGATNATLTLTNAQASDTGSYTVVVTNAVGSVTSSVGTLTLTLPPTPTAPAGSRLVNISILSAIDAPGDTFTLGYVVGGSGTSGTKPLVIRAVGPSLGALGVPGTLDDPKMELFAGAAKTGENDNWGGSAAIANAMAAVGAFACTGPTSRDAVVAMSVASGDNSVKVSGVGSGTGTVIAEIYDATPSANFTATTPRLVNVSVLKHLGTGLTVGFYVDGPGNKNVLVRVVGPTLGTAFGLGGVVNDPQFTLYSGQTAIGSNDNWGGTAALKAIFASAGAFAWPDSSRDAAVVAALKPGSYTVVVSGVGNTTGNALVEVYELSDTAIPPPAVAPAGFAQIPAGTFTMGDNLDGLENAPTHAVTLASFYMAKTETTKAEWDEVRTWALARGYTDLAVGSGKASNHPVQMVMWYDVIKWCNARSEKEGLVPVYFTNDAQTIIYRTGLVNITSAQVKWSATGYRLPTEAEWEYAARGGLTGKRFPWGDILTHQEANYRSSTGAAYDASPTRDYHPSYATGGEPYTAPVASFTANGYGLQDVAGNVGEWCWDWFGALTSAAVTAPVGPTSGEERVYRGGGWRHLGVGVRCAFRIRNSPDLPYDDLGFRPVRGSGP